MRLSGYQLDLLNGVDDTVGDEGCLALISSRQLNGPSAPAAVTCLRPSSNRHSHLPIQRRGRGDAISGQYQPSGAREAILEGP